MIKLFFPPAFFITGTDTEVGKTFISAILAIGLAAAYWKPIRTGLPYTDTDWIKDHTGLGEKHFFKERYLFAPHISPHEAARLANIRIDLEEIKLPKCETFSHLIVEGAGGIMVPINEKETILDLIAQMKIPVLVVARSGLGTINHTTLTVDKLRQQSIPILGIVMNGPKHDSNRRAIEHYAKVPVLAEVEPISLVTPETLKAAYNKYFGDNLTNEFASKSFASLASIYSS